LRVYNGPKYVVDYLLRTVATTRKVARFARAVPGSRGGTVLVVRLQTGWSRRLVLLEQRNTHLVVVGSSIPCASSAAWKRSTP
jgi:hypothetical protein